MNMKQIIKLFLVLSLVLLASCSTQQRVVYRDCDCNNSNFGFGWNNNPYLGWNSHRFWGWNDPFWGWNDPFWGWNRWNYSRPIIIYPKEPTRYERRQSIGARPSRNNQYRSDDNLYPGSSQPNRVQNRVESPSRVQNSTPSRVDNVYQQRSQPSRVQNNDPSRVETPSRVQQRQNTPVTTQPTRSRVQNREN
jgi:hypothetical protein